MEGVNTRDLRSVLNHYRFSCDAGSFTHTGVLLLTSIGSQLPDRFKHHFYSSDAPLSEGILLMNYDLLCDFMSLGL